MKILGISAFYHDSAAAIIVDGEIVAAAQEERFSRIKNDAGFPARAIRFCLEYSGYSLEELDAIAFYDKPFLKFERLLETYYAYAPSGWFSFLRSMPVWIKEKLFLKRTLFQELDKIGKLERSRQPLLFPEHHLSHAASAFYPSSFYEAAIVTLDGVGEWATMSICHGKGKDIRVLKELDFPHSLGLLYSAFTYYCGFSVNSGEYKLMGLAPYGNKDSAECRKMVELIKTKLVDIRGDGSIFLHQEYFDYATGQRMVRDRKWEELFGFGRRAADGALESCYCNMALAIQLVTEEIFLLLGREAQRLTNAENLCLAGGVALNGVAIFKKIFIQRAAGDGGGALGAALAAYHIYFEKERVLPVDGGDSLKGAYLGPEFSDKEISSVLRKYGARYRKIVEEEELLQSTSQLLEKGNVVGWFQGRAEFGPRALGSRSILADPRRADMQRQLNLRIKFREGFRPFAPAVTAEDAQEYFELQGSSPYMLFVRAVKEKRRYALPEGYVSWSAEEKLNFPRSDLPAITHIDYSARVQTVDCRNNARFWRLLRSFGTLTGYPVLVNTSFNIKDEPIVNSPEDAWLCFMQTGMDYLVIGNYVLDRRQQPAYEKGNNVT